MFIAHLAKEGIAHTSIKVYLAAIRYLHVSVGMHQTYNQQLSIPIFETCHERDFKGTAPWEISMPAPPHYFQHHDQYLHSTSSHT